MRVDLLSDPLQLLVDVRGVGPHRCPHCRTGALIRWGTFSGRQRFRCKHCRRTSSDLTGTALAYTKKLPVWGDFACCMLSGLPVRDAARRLGIHKDTAWRWRHRFLERLLGAREPNLRGTIDLLEVRVLVCRKGERRLRRPAIRRGRRDLFWPGFVASRPDLHESVPPDGSAPVLASEAATLLLARDRRECFRARLLWRPGHPRVEDVESLLADEPGQADAMCAERSSAPLRLLSQRGRLSAYARYAAQRGLESLRVPINCPPARPGAPGQLRAARTAEHLAGTLGAARRLRLWLKRFHGVATKYLLRYWAWHRFLGRLRWAEAARRLVESCAIPLPTDRHAEAGPAQA